MRRAVVVAMLAVVGCGTTTQPRAPHQRAQAREHVDASEPTWRVGPRSSDQPVAVARPALAAFATLVPDPEHDLRWPLSVAAHPELEPSFAIVPALAQPGIEWMELCRMGVMNRYGSGKLRDLTAYLRAWCTVADGNLDRGLSTLVGLQSSVTPRLGAAVRTDIVTSSPRAPPTTPNG